MPFAATWMDLYITIVSEVSQRKTNIIWYHSYVVSKKKNDIGVSIVTQQVTNLTSIHENSGLIPGLAQWIKDLHWHELWWKSQTWLRSCVPLSVATALIWFLVWECPYATDAALKTKETKKDTRELIYKTETDLQI